MELLVGLLVAGLGLWLALRAGKGRPATRAARDEEDPNEMSVDDMVLMDMLEDDDLGG